MQVLLVGFTFVLIALASILTSRIACANGQTHVFQVSCLPSANLFEIRDLGYFDEPSGLGADPHYDLTEKGQALYSPAWAVDQFRMASDERTESQVPSPTLFECRLRMNTVELYVVPLQSRRYRTSSEDILVSLSIAGRWVVDNVPFKLCGDRGPITRLTYEGDQKSVRFEGRFGGVWPDKVSSNEAWENRQRRYGYDGSRLRQRDPAIRSQKALPIPLRAEDIDYYLDASSESYGAPISDC